MKLRSKEIFLAYMEDKGFSNGQLADYSGCSRAFIGHLRTGLKSSCTPELAERIAVALGTPLAALFEERGPAGCGNGAKQMRKAA